MFVSDIVTRVLRTFGDDAQAQIQEADIIRWVNDAQVDMSNDENLFRVTATMSAVANQMLYTLPSNIMNLHSVKYNGKTLRSLSQQEADAFIVDNDDPTASNLPVGCPTHYWIWGSTLHLYPIPSESTDTIMLYYQRVPNNIANVTDTPDVPLVYHNALVEYCLVQAYALDDNLYGYQVRKIHYDETIQKLSDYNTWERREYYPFIGSSPGDVSVEEGYGITY